MEMPPIGIMPKWLHDFNRLRDVQCAIVRRYEAELPIPLEWVEEYNELVVAHKKHKERNA